MAPNPKPIHLQLLEGNPNRLTKSEFDCSAKAEASLNHQHGNNILFFLKIVSFHSNS
jgi:hypothetical protein